MKIRTMLMISAMLFAILPMVIYTVFANTLLSSDGDKQFRDTLLEVAENERYTLQTYLDTVDKQAETILKNTEVQDVIKSQKTSDYVGNYLVQFVNEIPSLWWTKTARSSAEAPERPVRSSTISALMTATQTALSTTMR